MFQRIASGEPLPVEEHFERRLEALLHQGETSGDYVEAAKEDFDLMEREAVQLMRERKSR